MNICSIMITILVILLSIAFCPAGPEQLSVMIRTRDSLEIHDAVTYNQIKFDLVKQWSLIQNTMKQENTNLTLHLVFEENILNKIGVDKDNILIGLTRNFSSSIQQGHSQIFIEKANAIERINWAKDIFALTQNFCVGCFDPNSNVCHNTQIKLLDNTNIQKCNASKNGHWGKWLDEENCQPIQEVILNEKCGVGFQMKTSQCQDRTFGGEYCKIDDKEITRNFQVKNVKCEGPPCPSKYRNN